MLHVPAGGIRHAEALGVSWDTVARAHWVPSNVDIAKVVRKMQIFAVKRRTGILGRGLRVSADAPAGSTASPFGLSGTLAHSSETIADLANAPGRDGSFSFAMDGPPVQPNARLIQSALAANRLMQSTLAASAACDSGCIDTHHA